nr:3D domain-containing protein [uncultured Blautia sp.]
MCYNTHRIAGRLAKVNQKEVTRSVNKRTTAFLLGSVLLCHASLVYGEVPDYNTVVEDTQKKNKAVQMFETDDGKGNTVQVAAHQETLYVTARKTGIYTMPSDSSAELAAVSLGDQVEQTAICDNGWSKVEAEADGEKVIGYIQTQALNSENQIVSMDAEEVEVTSDSSILDYPGKKDGEVVGEVLELDEVKRTGTVNNVWSRIEYQNADGTEQEGYIPTSCLNVSDGQESTEASIDTKKDAGTLHKSSGKGVFSDALETDESVTEQNGVQIGKAVAASSDAKLKDLGVFKITHYCPCSICCGPYANGITSTGVTATTNHTIAVDPSQIPYGSKVVINGQVYVAEDCGGAIKTNCIDIYVATHAEGEAKGVYYTDVYLIQ